MGSIQLRSVEKAFGAVKVINGVDLNIENGEFAVFVGPSGCGKSTLLRLIAGLEDVTSGQVLIDAKETYVINLDNHINRDVMGTDMGVEGQSTIQ